MTILDVIVLISVTDSCACSVQAVSMKKGSSDSSNVSTTLGPQLKPRLAKEGRNKKGTVKRNTAGFCFVLLFLVLEMLVCVILHLMVGKSKYR